ncbi:hypothetical protein B5M09_002500 [Aphanomyces astaci]|uniref:Endonuclease/exonuclease/phosphatase domain-containing protein n=1 Tax=Aphanomyces astaci TaxID=112090 RepID=A0A425DIZ9_APHAT|nr:hypothetical protein B5M09_002500 [Aphanomyces astaci]
MDSITAQYGGRLMVPATSVEHEGRECVSVLTYNVMRQMHATPDYKPYCDPAVLTATKRKEQIFQELLSYNADVLCLQEVDDFTLWWVPRLNEAGYDSVYHQRTGHFDDGLVIAFRRMYFQIFHTLRLDLNDLCNDPSVTANFAAKLQQDNVALVVALQPWEQCQFPSALCVSYNSGKTPRFTDGQIRTDICPRPSHLIPFPKGDPYDSVHVRGDREAKLVHFEVFDSAYAQYYNGGEPDFTYSDHVFTGTVDYIFYSKKVKSISLLCETMW